MVSGETSLAAEQRTGSPYKGAADSGRQGPTLRCLEEIMEEYPNRLTEVGPDRLTWPGHNEAARKRTLAFVIPNLFNPFYRSACLCQMEARQDNQATQHQSDSSTTPQPCPHASQMRKQPYYFPLFHPPVPCYIRLAAFPGAHLSTLRSKPKASNETHLWCRLHPGYAGIRFREAWIVIRPLPDCSHSMRTNRRLRNILKSPGVQ